MTQQRKDDIATIVFFLLLQAVGAYCIGFPLKYTVVLMAITALGMWYA